MRYRLVGDFETTAKEDDCRVWASCLYDIDSDRVVHISNNITDTMEVLKATSKKVNIDLYYHNLKFDGEFILSWLFDNGFKYDDLLSDRNTFRTLITDTGVFYQLEIKFYKGKNAKKVVIKDSLKILPLPVEALAKAFDLSTMKGEIDYTSERPVGHIITNEEEDYIVRDCKIVAQSLKEIFNLGLEKMTIGSNALANYKESIGGNAKFRGLFPKLSYIHKQDKNGNIETVDDYVRKSYKGGYVYVNPKYQGKVIKNGGTWDVTSLYPSRMRYDLLPYDTPIYYKGKYVYNHNYPLAIFKVKCKFKLKKGYVPIIQLKNNARFSETEYLKDSGVERVTLTVTNVDWEMIEKHYDLMRVEYIDGYMFKGKVGLFNNYIDHWIGVKTQADIDGNKGMRTIAKLFLNNLYGKFAVNPQNDVKVPTLESGVVHHKSKLTMVDEIKKGVDYEHQLKEEKERELCYTPMACFITAYARKLTQEGIQANYDSFVYADTDSIHLTVQEAKGITVHPTNLGEWKHESNWRYGKFLRAKTYIEEIYNEKKGEWELDVKCAGMPKNVKAIVNKKNFKIGFNTADMGLPLANKKLVPKRVKGGVVLVPTDFTIK